MLNILKKCKNYNNLIGRNEIKSELIKLAQTMDDRFIVFVGSQGTDKEAWADALASNLLCENPREDGACLACRACRYLENGTHPDYLEINPEKDSKNIAIQTIRDRVHAEINILPQLNNVKLWRIDANALQEGAQNALLKVLEEPPSYAYFILTIDDRTKLLPTLRSRAREIKIPAMSRVDLNTLLDQHDVSDPNQRSLAINFSSGLPELALQLAEDEGLQEERKNVFKWFVEFLRAREVDVLTTSYDFWDKSKSSMDTNILFLQSFLRDMVLLHAKPEIEKDNLLNQDMLNYLQRLNQEYKFSVENLSNALRTLNEVSKRSKANVNFEISICGMLLKMRNALNLNK